MQETVGTGEFARLLQVDTATVRRWERRGVIPEANQTPGGVRRWDRDDVKKTVTLISTYGDRLWEREGKIKMREARDRAWSARMDKLGHGSMAQTGGETNE